MGGISLVPRPSHVFQCCTWKGGRLGRLCDVMMMCGHYSWMRFEVSAYSPTRMSTCTVKLQCMLASQQKVRWSYQPNGLVFERTINKAIMEEAQGRSGAREESLGENLAVRVDRSEVWISSYGKEVGDISTVIDMNCSFGRYSPNKQVTVRGCRYAPNLIIVQVQSCRLAKTRMEEQ